MAFEVRKIMDGATRVDWERQLLVIRKARTLPDGAAPEFKYAQAKCDGIRLVVAKDLDSYLHAFTTQGHDIMLDHLDHPLWKRFMILEGNWIDGELCVPGKGAEAVKTALKQNTELEFIGFGCSWLPPSAELVELERHMRAHGLKSPEFATDHMQLIDAHDREGHYGFDGVVFKDSMYGAWAKRKHVKTIDLIVTGFVSGMGSRWGKVGALRCSLADGTEICRCSGMNNDELDAITQRDIGRVVEVEYERVASRGRLRHPRFMRWRDDKDASECGRDQDSLL